MEHSENPGTDVSPAPRNDTYDCAAGTSLKKTISIYALGFLIFAIIVGGFIWLDLSSEYREALAYWDARLSNSADEGVSCATLWLIERRTDTVAVASSKSA